MPARSAPLWLATSSRYAGVPRTRARAILALLALAMLASLPWAEWLRPPAPATPQVQIKDSETDLALYDTIADEVRHGGDYYQVTAQELRARPGYPLRPFVTFRPPLLALIQAALPRPATLLLLWLLAGGVALAWARRLAPAVPANAPRTVAALLLAGGLIAFVQPALMASHEVWAGLLIALSLALRRPGRWIEAVALAAIVMLIRELAALYAVAMLALAWREGERREALGWLGALGVLALATLAHAWAVAQVVTPIDPASDGWSGLHGLPFFAVTIQHATVLEALPFGLVAPLVPLALFGWTAWRSPLALRVAATLALFAALIALAARHNNFYWGLIPAPLWLLGLLFVPDGLRDLWRAALDRRRITVTRVVR